MLRNIFLILILLISKYTIAQVITVNDTIPWTNNPVSIENVSVKEKFYMFDFPGAQHEEYWLPYKVKLIETKDNLKIKSIKLTGSKASIIQTNAKDISGAKHLPKDFVVKANIFKSADKSYIIIKVLPLKKVNGQIYKLESYKIELTLEKNPAKKKENTRKSNSVLSSGNWVKIAIPKRGVYKISYEELKELGFDNPEQVRVFGNDFGQLPFMNYEPRPDDLRENKVMHLNNYLYFYAEGSYLWTYDTLKGMYLRKPHYYSDTAYYFLSDVNTGYGNIIGAYAQPYAQATRQYSDYLWFDIHEKDYTNLLSSGRTWYGTTYSDGQSREIDFDTNNIVTTKPAVAEVVLMSRSFYPSSFTVEIESNTYSVSFPSVTTVTGSQWGYVRTNYYSFNPSASGIKTTLTYHSAAPSSYGYPDKITVNAYRYLSYRGQTDFSFPGNAGSDEITEAFISYLPDNAIIWDITNTLSPQRILPYDASGKKAFKFTADTLRRFVMFTPEDAYTPVLDVPHTGKVYNQNLHATAAETEMLIITPPELGDIAKKLAQLHMTYDNLKVKTATTESIYNEFSSGIPDAVAIRDYIRFVYNLPGSQLKYVILLGDGSYLNKPYPGKKHNSNLIPTYQTLNSLNEDGYLSITSDDFFTLLDDNEGETSGLSDVYLGRIPVKNHDEAQLFLEKTEHYLKNQSRSDWINNTMLLADNGSDNLFLDDAEDISDYIDNSIQQLIIDKIYLPSFPGEATLGGKEYPLAVKAVFNAVESGTAVFTFLGHGNYQVMTAERVVTMSDLANWTNYDKLFLLQSGTCNFGRFDLYFLASDRNVISGGEYSVLNPKGGAIAAVTTTRYSYTSINYLITSTVFEYIYKNKTDGSRYTVGEALTLAKNLNPGYYNKIYTLLGDPAIVINNTPYRVHISQITPDTLKALSTVTVKGYITDNDNTALNNIDGEVSITVLDKKREVKTLDLNNPYTYWTQNDILFRGKASVRNGTFEIKFIVPKDMVDYSYGNSKISMYTYDYASKEQGSGYQQITVGGLNDTIIDDKTGPDIKIFFNDTTFINGGITNQNPKLLVFLEDESGINTTNSDMGHVLKAVLDGKEEFVLNKYYSADLDTYKKGKVEFNLYKIPEGKHTLKVEAYDILNNKSEKSIDFVVANNENPVIDRLFNYPNPFTTYTGFYFTHNMPGERLDVLLQVFSVSGRLVKTIHTTIESDSFVAGPIEWDGKDDYGHPIGKGVYLYRVVIQNEKGEKAEKFEKLLILK